MTIKRKITYSADLADHDFPIPFPYHNEGDELLHISPDGRRAVLGVLVRDDSPFDPFEEWDEGEFYQFNSRYIHDASRPEIEDFKRIIRANPGRVFTVCRCGDGYAVDAGPLTAADTRNSRDGSCNAESALDSAAGYYICPADATDPAKYADGALASYTAFCEGDVWGVCVWTFTRESDGDQWEETDRDECWGFYGSEYATEELQGCFAGHIKEEV